MAKKRRRRSKGKSRKHARRHVAHRRRKSAHRRSRKGGKGKAGRLFGAYYRKHKAALARIPWEKRAKYIWSKIKRGQC